MFLSWNVSQCQSSLSLSGGEGLVCCVGQSIGFHDMKDTQR